MSECAGPQDGEAGVGRHREGDVAVPAGIAADLVVATRMSSSSVRVGVLLAELASLYLPTSWTDDRERCRAASIEDTVACRRHQAIDEQ